MASSSAIADALITMLSAASVFGTNMVTKNDYSVLEKAAGSCATITWTNLKSVAVAFGNDRERSLTMRVDVFVRDTSNPIEVLNNVYTAGDVAVTCLEADDTLQGTVNMVDAIQATRNPDRFVQAGGVTWLPVEILVEVTEL